LLDQKPGPKIGMIMNALMEEVLENPALNTEEYLKNRTADLALMSEVELSALSQQGKAKSKELEDEEVDKIKAKHFVK